MYHIIRNLPPRGRQDDRGELIAKCLVRLGNYQDVLFMVSS